MAVYDIDLLRALFVDKLNDNTIFLASFYEQLQDDEQINRYVDSIKELLALQNREKSESNYKAMGIIAQSGNAEIINIKQNYISPLEYQARFDIELNDRDYVLGKLKTLINDLRGRKFDIIQLTNNTTFIPKIPQIATATKRIILQNDILITPIVSIDPNSSAIKTQVINDIVAKYTFSNNQTYTVYQINKVGFISQLLRRTFVRNSSLVSTLSDVTVIGDIQNQRKLSLSFDGIQSQEPYINNGVDRVFLFFGGSATIVDENVTLGNDIIITAIQVGKLFGDIYTVEPTEIPASLSVSDDTFQTYANGYRTQDRNMAIGNKMSYSFIYDNTITLYNDLYAYARFGTTPTGTASTLPQQIFAITEYRYAFGVLTTNTFYAKLGDVATSNTNGDVMTLSVNFKVGDY
jgi:hypothetical protein